MKKKKNIASKMQVPLNYLISLNSYFHSRIGVFTFPPRIYTKIKSNDVCVHAWAIKGPQEKGSRPGVLVQFVDHLHSRHENLGLILSL